MPSRASRPRPNRSRKRERARHGVRNRPNRFQAVATDYDGTLAEDGVVSERTLAALERARDAGRKLVLVTGRELDELMNVFPRIDAFDVVVAENGALLYTPRPTPRERPLASAPPFELVQELVRRGVGPISCGRIIVATWEPHQQLVLETIRDLGLELEVIFNKGAVMILPSGVNKASGLRAALADLGIDPKNVVGIGDAENDHSLLGVCGFGVAVANAVPALRERADLVTVEPRGAGVVEMIDELIETDFEGVRKARRLEIVAPVVPGEARLGGGAR